MWSKIREEYIEKINLMKKYIPNLVLSTDIIVGFPGETEAEYEETVSLVKEIGYETMFAFMYSPRPFTKAAAFTDHLPEEVKNRRLNALFDSHEKQAFELAKKYDGQVLNVLVEQINVQGKAQGRSTQKGFLPLHLQNQRTTHWRKRFGPANGPGLMRWTKSCCRHHM